jgi:hypothetical protein
MLLLRLYDVRGSCMFTTRRQVAFDFTRTHRLSVFIHEVKPSLRSRLVLTNWSNPLTRDVEVSSIEPTRILIMSSPSSSMSNNAPSSKEYYIYITSARLPSIKFPRFGWFTTPVIPLAKRSPGNVLTKTTMREGITYTLTVWESRQHMLKFMRLGAHTEVMGDEHDTGIVAQTYGYESSDIPNWNEAIAILQKERHSHFDHRAKDATTSRSWRSNLIYLVIITAVLVLVWLLV